jgi:hypothetical protein
MDKQIQTEYDENAQIAVREPTDRLLQERHHNVKKGSATIDDVYVEEANTDWYEYAVIEISYNSDTKDTLTIPIYEGSHTDERLESILKYTDSTDLYDLMGEEVPAFRSENGEWRIYVPNRFGSGIQEILFKSPMTRVSGVSIKPNLGFSAFVSVCSLILLSAIFIIPIVVSILIPIVVISLLSIQFELPGEFI